MKYYLYESDENRYDKSGYLETVEFDTEDELKEYLISSWQNCDIDNPTYVCQEKQDDNIHKSSFIGKHISINDNEIWSDESLKWRI
jgi:hypothetical protein